MPPQFYPSINGSRAMADFFCSPEAKYIRLLENAPVFRVATAPGSGRIDLLPEERPVPKVACSCNDAASAPWVYAGDHDSLDGAVCASLPTGMRSLVI